MIKIPKFYLVSTNPNRENTEDYLRNHLHVSKFYADPIQTKNSGSKDIIIMP